MARTETILRVFVASPSDVEEERVCLEEIIKELNIIWSKQLGIRLDLIKWETHAFPGIGTDAQTVVNDQIEDDYDIFIGIMWKKVGCPTNRAASGTIEEFERAYTRYLKDSNIIRIMFYFKDTPVQLSEIDPIQLAAINEFRKKLGEKGALYWPFTERDEFSSLIRMHLSRQVQDWKINWGITKSEDTKDLQISSNDTNNIAVISVDNEYEEEGLIDLIELGQENFENLTEVVERMAEAIEDLGNKITERTEELNRIQTNTSQVSINTAKRIFKRTSEDMEQFVSRMEPEIPIFKDSLAKGIDALTRASILNSDFDEDSEKSIINTIDMIAMFKNGLQEVHSTMISFRDSVASAPRIYSEFNRSKRKVITTLNGLINEMITADNLTTEINIELKRLITK